MAKPKTSMNPGGLRRDEQFQRDKKRKENPKFIWKTNKRGRKVKTKNPKWIAPTTKSDGSKPEPTTSGSKESQAKAQQKVIDRPEYQKGLKEMQAKWKKDAERKEKMKIKGKGPVKSGKEYGKHLDKQSKKYETKGEGPVKDSKKYGKTVVEKPKKTEAEERKEWEKKTRRSPARRSGAFSDQELWDQQKKHRQREKDKKEGKLKREKFDPRRPRGYKRKMVEKTPAELAADKRRRKQLDNAKKDTTSKKSDINKKKERGFSVKNFPGSYNIA
jgi:hypothetical protein